MTRRLTVFGAIAFIAILGVLLGMALARHFGSSGERRPGERTLLLFAPPQTALAISLDPQPGSFDQAEAFRRIASALEREGLNRRIESSLNRAADSVPVLRDLMPSLTGAGGVLIWDKPGQPDAPNLVIVVRVRRESDAITVLKRHAIRTDDRDGPSMYFLNLSPSGSDSPFRGDIAAVVTDGYLLLSEPSSLQVVRNVHRAQRTSLAADPAFVRLRGKLPADANLLCYVSPDLIRRAQRQSGPPDETTVRLLSQVQPACFSATLRKDGIVFDSVTGGDADALRPMAGIAPIKPEAALRIPPGSLGLVVMAQPGKCLAVFEEAVRRSGGESLRSWERSVAEFERQTQLSLDRDVLRALSGHLTVAAYPGSHPDSVDLLAVLDNSHGANPARLADRLADSITAHDARLTFPRRTAKDAVYRSLPTDWKVSSPGAPAPDRPLPSEQVAQIDRAVLFATAPDLLNRSVDAFRKPPAVPLPLSTLTRDRNIAFVLETKAVVNWLRPKLTSTARPTSDTDWDPNDLSALCGDAPLMASAGYRDDCLTGSLELPIDFAVAARLSRRLWDLSDRNR
ncbi:MAG: DUF3352 domain-containing protein [Capsulimonadales bacterium]|nr:DUF3352 domain-containing protein [Capsulimonadales bacterium]